MHLHTRNVNTAFNSLVGLFASGGEFVRIPGAGYSGPESKERIQVTRKESRNGPVLMIEEPVIVTYSHPLERVLFNAARDANPYFHLYEALWMLAGRNDVEPLAYYASNMRNYSDDGVTLNGAYGYRWRHSTIPGYQREPGYANMAEGIDQLDILVDHLKAQPNSRRAVLQMWNVDDDLIKVGGIMGSESIHTLEDAIKEFRPSKDVCCNLSVMFSIRREFVPKVAVPGGPGRAFFDLLDMTVTNRSNDLIWGMLGANYVHFSFLQEYMAARLGVAVGVYNHMTNNLHVYESNWKPQEWLGDSTAVFDYSKTFPDTFPLVKDPALFEKLLPQFVDYHKDNRGGPLLGSSPFLETVAHPMLTAFHKHRAGNSEEALEWCSAIAAHDWRIAATDWIQRRIGNALKGKRQG